MIRNFTTFRSPLDQTSLFFFAAWPLTKCTRQFQALHCHVQMPGCYHDSPTNSGWRFRNNSLWFSWKDTISQHPDVNTCRTPIFCLNSWTSIGTIRSSTKPTMSLIVEKTWELVFYQSSLGSHPIYLHQISSIRSSGGFCQITDFQIINIDCGCQLKVDYDTDQPSCLHSFISFPPLFCEVWWCDDRQGNWDIIRIQASRFGSVWCRRP